MADKKEKGYKKYQEETNTFAYSLVLILPLLLIYEAGVRLVNDSSFFGMDDVLANELIVIIFRKLNLANVTIIPAFLIMVTLFFMQFKSGKKWEIHFPNILMMHVEYLVLGALYFFATAWLIYGRLGFSVPNTKDVLLSLGAGVYEEFLFRFILLSGLMYILDKGLKVEKQRRVYTSVIVSAILFAAFHHMLGGSFLWSTFLFRTAAGVYFGILYLQRGYGIAAGTHAAYNILTVMLTGAGGFTT